MRPFSAISKQSAGDFVEAIGTQRSTFKLGEFTESWPQSDLEKELASAGAERGLALSRAMANYSTFNRKDWHTDNYTIPVYMFTSSANHGYMHFELRGFRIGLEAQVLILAIEPAFQGNYWNFADFVRRVSGTLFSLRSQRVYRITGTAMGNQFPVRSKPNSTKSDWRDEDTKDRATSKLVRLYERVGCVRVPSKPNVVCMYSPGAWELLVGIENPLKLHTQLQSKTFERKRI